MTKKLHVKIGTGIFVSVMLVLLASIMYACVEEDLEEVKSPDEPVTGRNTELTVETARQWYNTRNRPVMELRSEKENEGKLVMPWWEKAKEYKRKERGKRYEVVEMPLKAQRLSVLMDKETHEKVNLETDGDKIKNVARLVVHKDLETGKIQNFIMLFIGSYDYLMNGGKIAKNSYLHRDPKFDGSVLFYEPGKGLINGWLYKNGKIKRKIALGTEQDSHSIGLRSQRCWTEIIYIEYEVCEDRGFIEWDEEYGGYIPGVEYYCSMSKNVKMLMTKKKMMTSTMAISMTTTVVAAVVAVIRRIPLR
jgi:hypothetical protein